MTRVKRGVISRQKHKKLHNLTKGFRGTQGKLIRVAKQAELHARAYAYHGRKIKKRDFRALWITRIGEAAKKEGVSYSTLIAKLKKANVELDRKILSELVVNDPNIFRKIVESVRNIQ